MDLRVLDDAAGAAAEAADWTAHQLRNAVRRRGAATIAVSGGSTPAAMFAALADLDLPWAAITVYQVDERVAPDGDPARNAALLAAFPAAAHVRPMPVTSKDLRAAARRYAEALPPRLDVVHLGLGDDGHTASWPPGDPVGDETAPVALSREYRGHVRMTLTPPVVNAARHRLVLAAGSDKAAPLEGWLLGNDALPIRRVRVSDTVVVVDRAAAARLPGMAR
ncbi:MAG: 6-phosphogluconolactonase/glucose-6-phosphate isomerase [Actinomycetota bacterium]